MNPPCLYLWLEEQERVGEGDDVFQEEKEKERRRERAREIGGWSLTSKQSVGWVERAPPPPAHAQVPMRQHLIRLALVLLLYQASYPALAVRIVRVMHLGSMIHLKIAG